MSIALSSFLNNFVQNSLQECPKKIDKKNAANYNIRESKKLFFPPKGDERMHKQQIAEFEQSEYWQRVDKEGNPLSEPQEVNVVVKRLTRNNFMVTYLAELVGMLDSIGNKRMKVVKYILANMDKGTNKLTETTAEIAANSGSSRTTVSETLCILEKAGFIARKTGVVMLSPKIVHKGSAYKEHFLLTKFREMREGEINEPQGS